MGWTTTNNHGLSRKAFLDRQFTSINAEGTTWEIVDSAMVGTVYYAVAQRISKTECKFFGMVVLTNSGERHDRYYNIGYKEMEEGMGPVQSNAPIRMIKYLDKVAPVDPTSYAGQWRARCRANHAARKAHVSVGKQFKDGAFVKFAEPLTFFRRGDKNPMGTYDTFRVNKNGAQLRFTPVGTGLVVRIPNAGRRDHEFLPGDPTVSVVG